MSTTAETTRAIAAALGQGWHSEPGLWGNNEDGYICGPGAERVHFMSGRYGVAAGRAELTGTLTPEQHQERSYKEKIPSITVSLSKTPQQIARDIERRLLPEYRRILGLVIERQARSDQAEAARLALSAQLAAALGVTPDARDNGRHLYLGRYGEPLHGEVEVRSSTYSVTFKLEVSPAMAPAVAEAIAALHANMAPVAEVA